MDKVARQIGSRDEALKRLSRPTAPGIEVREMVERLRDELHTVLWDAAKTAKPLRGYPVVKEQLGAFNYGKDCAAADIEQALDDLIERLGGVEGE